MVSDAVKRVIKQGKVSVSYLLVLPTVYTLAHSGCECEMPAVTLMSVITNDINSKRGCMLESLSLLKFKIIYMLMHVTLGLFLHFSSSLSFVIRNVQGICVLFPEQPVFFFSSFF